MAETPARPTARTPFPPLEAGGGQGAVQRGCPTRRRGSVTTGDGAWPRHMVVGVDEFDRLRAPREASLHELLSRSPLNRLDFGGELVRSPVREVDL